MTVESNNFIQNVDDTLNLKTRLRQVFIDVDVLRSELFGLLPPVDEAAPEDVAALSAAHTIVNTIMSQLGLTVIRYNKFSSENVELSTITDWS